MQHCLQKRKVPISLSVVLFWEVDGWQMGGVWWIFVFFFLKNLEGGLHGMGNHFPCQDASGKWRVSMRGFPPAEKIICHPGVDTAASWQGFRILKGSPKIFMSWEWVGCFSWMIFLGVILLVICVFSPGSLRKHHKFVFGYPTNPRHGRFKPRSELGRLEVGGGAGDGHPKLVGLGSGKPTPQKWRKHAA